MLRLPSRAALADAAITFLLDVLGMAGAIWGAAEAAGVRDAHNAAAWRGVAATGFALGLVRWSLQRAAVPLAAHVDAVCTFVLQVLGGCGAIWGGAEIVGVRSNFPGGCRDAAAFPRGVGGAWAPGFPQCRSNYWLWRVVMVPTLVFFVAYWYSNTPSDAASAAVKGDAEEEEEQHQRAGHNKQTTPKHEAATTTATLTTMFTHLLATFMLEVVGGAGALWGAAEVAGLRLGWSDAYFGQLSFDRWRFGCAAAFVVSFVRWLGVRWLSRRRTRSLRSSAGPSKVAAAAETLLDAEEARAMQRRREVLALASSSSGLAGERAAAATPSSSSSLSQQGVRVVVDARRNGAPPGMADGGCHLAGVAGENV